MNINRLPFDGVKDKIIFNNEVAIMQLGKLFFLRHSTQVWVLREKFKIPFNFRGKGLCCRGSVSRNVRYDLRKVILSDP